MPRRCCIPGCKGNYDSTLKSNKYVSVFKFPTNEELRKKWIDAIPRKHWTPSKHSAVCSRHFVQSDITKYEELPSSNDKKVSERCPRLVQNAVPTIFPNLPNHLTKLVLPRRNKPESRRKRVIQNHEPSVQEFEDPDLISNFIELRNKYKKQLVISKCCNIILTDSKMYFYKLDYENDLLVLNIQIVINDEMKLHIFHKGNAMSFNDLKWVLPIDMKLSRWSQLQNILVRYKFALDVPDSDRNEK